MPTKLYVGNLAYSVTNEDLEGLFSQAGKVDSAVVVVDKFSGQSRGFGFVEMADSNDAARAIEEFNDAELKGRNIRVNEARPREGGGGPRRLRRSRALLGDVPRGVRAERRRIRGRDRR